MISLAFAFIFLPFATRYSLAASFLLHFCFTHPLGFLLSFGGAKQSKATLIRSVEVQKGSNQDVHEQQISDGDAHHVDPQRGVGSELFDQRGAHGEVARVPGRCHHGEVERVEHHAEIEQTPLPTVLRRNLEFGALLRVRLVIGLFVLLLRRVALDSESHPEPRDHIQHHVDRGEPVVAGGEEGVACLRITDFDGSDLSRRGQHRTDQIEHDDDEEDGRGEQAAVELLGEGEGEAAETHQKRHRYHHDVARAHAVLVEQRVAEGEEKMKAKAQDDAARDRAKSEEEPERDVHRLPLVRAAAGLVGVVVALLGVRWCAQSHVGLVHFVCQNLMDREGQIDERHQLENQVEERSDAGKAAVEVNPPRRTDAPKEQPGEENQDQEEDPQEHMMGCWPSQGGQEKEQEGAEKSTAGTINNLNSVSSEDFVKIAVHDLQLRREKTMLHRC